MRISGMNVAMGGVRGWLAAASLVLAGAGAVAHAAPRAGSVIGNQATATFVDGSGVTRNTTSNLVETIVAQVAGVDIEANQTKTSAPGATVYFPHSVTNTGNGNDTYTLTTALGPNGTFTFGSVTVYPDANADGIPDNFTPITVTPSLAPGQVYNVVVAVTVPGTVTAGQTDNFTITSTSQFTSTVTDFNTDAVTITNNAVIVVTKAEDITSGPPGTTPVTITLTYTNTGNTTATNVTLTDSLPNGMTYIAGSGRWSATTPTALTDAVGGDGAGIDYSATGNSISATIASVGQGVSGFVRFQASVNANAVAGPLPNTARFTYIDVTGGTPTTPTPTNTVIFTVTPNNGVVLSDTGSTTDTDGVNNDVVQIAAASQAAVLRFDNRLTNTGNATDTFNLTFANVNYPVGTTFQLLQADGVTPLTDTNRDGIPDTGPVAAGATVSIFLRVNLPPGATGAGPYNVTKTATSITNPAVTDSTTDRLLTITNSSVDLTNNSAGPTALGHGQGPEPTPVTTVTVLPGAAATFSLFVNNTSAVPDNYNLGASTDSTFATIALPPGWTVTFRNAANGVITNTGTIAAGGNVQVIAQVTVPAGAAPAPAPGTSIFFRVVSPATGALDVKNDAVIVTPIRDLSLTPNNVGQGFPGSVVLYTHTLTINSSVAETSAPLTTTNSQPLWTSVIYYDANGNGTIDPTDPVVANISDIDALVPGAGLAPGTSYPLLVRVFVPSGANPADQNTTTFTVGTVAGETNTLNNVATDVTTVVTGDVRLEKTQALDANCDGTPETGFGIAQLANATPGSCIVYRITATDAGSTAVSALVISDATPALTTYNNCGGACPAVAQTGTVAAPPSGIAGTVTNTVGTLGPGASTTLTFTVRINP